MKKFQFVAECWAETMLVRILFLQGGHHTLTSLYDHAVGISDVPRILKTTKEEFIKVAFVDNDKGNVPAYFDEFEILDERANVLFKKHVSLNEYLIIVDPAIELFLLSQLKEIRKKASLYGLADDLKSFKKELKSKKLEHNQGYAAMINDLRDKHSSGIAFMIEKIKGLR